MAKNCNFIEKLRETGLRPTKQRVKICEVLYKREKTFHFTINELVKKISEENNQKISLATVYNTVHAFKKKGYLKDYLQLLKRKKDFLSILTASRHKKRRKKIFCVLFTRTYKVNARR